MDFFGVHSFKIVTVHILFLPVECVLDVANIRAIKLPSILKATIPHKQISLLYYADVPISTNGRTANRQRQYHKNAIIPIKQKLCATF